MQFKIFFDGLTQLDYYDGTSIFIINTRENYNKDNFKCMFNLIKEVYSREKCYLGLYGTPHILFGRKAERDISHMYDIISECGSIFGLPLNIIGKCKYDEFIFVCLGHITMEDCLDFVKLKGII